MNTRLRAEVHFYTASDAGVQITKAGDRDTQEFEEILLFCCFAAEQLTSAGKKMSSQATLVALLLINMRGSLTCLARHQSPHHPEVGDYRGFPGRKRFVGELSHTPGKSRFEFSTRGFTLFRRNREYYETHAILVLLRHLAKKRMYDDDYLAALSGACSEVGLHYLRGDFERPERQDVARMIALQAAGRMSMERRRAAM